MDRLSYTSFKFSIAQSHVYSPKKRREAKRDKELRATRYTVCRQFCYVRFSYSQGFSGISVLDLIK